MHLTIPALLLNSSVAMTYATDGITFPTTGEHFAVTVAAVIDTSAIRNDVCNISPVRFVKSKAFDKANGIKQSVLEARNTISLFESLD